MIDDLHRWFRARRKRLWTSLFAIPVLALPLDASAGRVSSAAASVELQDGQVRGTIFNDVAAFRGIPYAAPPVGTLRWRAPQPVVPWKGVLEATAYQHDCMQRSTSTFALGTTKPSEDCLYLNVFKPVSTKADPLPVMVYIHGGGFIQGGTSAIVYDGNNLARHGVVVVTLNYRLGRFGFFAHPALAREHPEEPKGNYAFLDQIAALQWIQGNIARFGGNPSNVTIFGQSAGGMSVEAMLASPMATGLFHKAIIESAPARLLVVRRLDKAIATEPSLEDYGIAFARSKGIEGEASQDLADLRALPADQFLDFSKGLLREGEAASMSWGGPVLDGRILPADSTDLFARGALNKVTVIVGANTDDVPLAPKTGEPFARFGANWAEAVALYDPSQTGNAAEINHKMALDEILLEPTRYLANAFADAGQLTYVYRFGYVTQGLSDRWAAGAPHGAELGYVFDNVSEYYGPVATQRDIAFGQHMANYWTNFARTGDPNGSGLPIWPQYDPQTESLLLIKPDGAAAGATDPLADRLHFWTRIKK